ncbi:hypothetical protein AMIS_48920 [Actinoplanes missouriensis 431]|uniref:Uncharacterized protein n=1 Tax=Actinoplanes missouriensis (strain ATCC 14538 / DSM 43046 / CBS 188.64 / JCM 3121 / NBRC 102363 / NCIMB 12654 / NRRL B-3342 / UNCC 431) TaxID=512565 RepID=I0HAS5_ACTM4|nr:hypothetical protein [Actinoplanes missouriensis]BAL90112.1 hypothetical protein AMIS_48920 [Actinoplanes missouriensis 431]
MIDQSEFDDVMLTLGHPWGDVDILLSEWAVRGPYGGRPFVSVTAAKRVSTGERLALDEIPPEYLNTPTTRQMQREGELPTPWGPPPDELPRPALDSLPPDMREEFLRLRYGDDGSAR